MRNFRILSILSILIFILFCGCSGGNDPIALSTDDPVSLPQIGQPSEESGLLGIFEVHIDGESLQGEMLPIREASSKDVLEVIDITYFLTALPCDDCARIKSIALNVEGNLVLNIGIHHPFKPGNSALPPSASNRLDLHLFNIEGIVVIDSGESSEFTQLQTVVDKKTLLNASGYTGYLDNSLDLIKPTAATIHPYVLHFRDYTDGNFNAQNPHGFADLTNPSGFHVMAMGSDEDVRPYVFDLQDDESLNFIYVIGATYGISADSPSQRLEPVYHLPQFNKKAASEVFVKIIDNNLIPEYTSSSVILNLDVLDMNYAAEVGDAVNQIRAESKISNITVLIPGIGDRVSFNPVPTGGDPRDPDNPLTFQYEIFNSSAGGAGHYSGIVKVTDSCQTGLNENAILSGNDGVSKAPPGQNPLSELFHIDEFVTWQYFEIEILANEPPVAVLEATDYEIESDSTVDLFPGVGTYDPDGVIVLYEYDFEYDGVDFVADISNSTGEPVTTPVYSNFSSDPVIYQFALRVTDDGIPAQTATDEISVVVLPYSTNGWGVTWGGDYSDTGISVSVNENDGIYVTGSFRGTVDFDPSLEINEITSAGTGDCYLSKFDFDRNLIWVRTWGGADDSPDGDTAHSVAIDPNGWIYVTGVFFGTVDLDPGSDIDEYISNGNSDVFISRFDLAGNFDSGQTFGGAGSDTSNSIAVDNSGSLVICGEFDSISDFDPGTGIDEHTPVGFVDSFAAMYNSDLSYSWANNWGGSLTQANSIATDSGDNIYITGAFMDTVDFDSGTGIDERFSNGESDVYLLKLESDGSYLWTSTWGSAGDLYWQRDVGYSVAVDNFDNAYVTGSFYGVVDFDTGTGVDEKTALGASDAFLCTYNSDGEYLRTLVWGTESDELYKGESGVAVKCYSDGNVFVTGGFYSTVDFDPGAGIVERSSMGSVDVFLSKFDSTGNLVWVNTWGGSGTDDGISVGSDSYGTSYVTGYFSGTVDLNPGFDSDEHTSNGYYDVFLSKFPSDGEW